ncbi:unnamed protein product [Acanthoscelides obtectus]|nr:unnamed protein product [Acanthoscelides obtectus]CAK1675065.1 Aldose 1-epimerase [Acanthoscelides obtectus]
MSGIVKNSTFQLNNKQYWLTPNYLERHHINGGATGLDQVVWNTYVDGPKVIMTHISPHLTEGYPGDLFIKIIFQLSERNEFKINMEAMCTEPTIINLSNLTYFNLAGHHRGADEIYRHVVSLNCNCYTPQVSGFPTGDIQNVVYSPYDFQIPILLGKLIGIVPKDGYNQNLCVNRGADQDECFVGRVFHPPSGRLLEIYSNQCGVNFSTANEFGYGRLLSIQDIMPQNYGHDDEFMNKDPLLNLMEKMHEKLIDNLKEDEKTGFEEIRSLIMKFKPTGALPAVPDNTDASESEAAGSPQAQSGAEYVPSKLDVSEFQYTTKQKKYLENMLNLNCEDDDEDECMRLKDIAANILRYASHRKSTTGATNPISQQQPSQSEIPSKLRSSEKKRIRENIIPSYYKKSNQIIGKSRKVYTMHGGIALQTQNYPDCANCKNFPECRLYPGQTYTHSITYKFWIRAGSPNKWIKRNMNDATKRA